MEPGTCDCETITASKIVGLFICLCLLQTLRGLNRSLWPRKKMTLGVATEVEQSLKTGPKTPSGFKAVREAKKELNKQFWVLADFI